MEPLPETRNQSRPHIAAIRPAAGFLLAVAIFFNACVPTPPAPTPTARKYASLIVETRELPAAELLWSPQGDRLLVTIGDPVRLTPFEIVVIDIRTKQSRAIVSPEHGMVTATSWAPDSKHFVLRASAGNSDFKEGLWIVDADGLEPPKYIGEGIAGAWSPSDDVLAVAKAESPPGQVSIDLQDLGTHHEQRVFVEGGPSIGSLSWSPDSSRLAFIFGEDTSTSDIVVLDIATGSTSRLTSTGRVQAVSWSPNGDKMVYSSWDPEQLTWEVHIATLLGDCDVLVPSAAGIGDPAWSPDGNYLAFSDGLGIYLFDLAAVFGPDFLARGLPCP